MPLGFLAFLVSIAYLPGITSAAVAPRWWAIVVGAPLVLLFVERIRPELGHALGLLFFAAAALSIFWSVSPIDTANFLFLLAGLGAVFCAAAEEQSLEPVWLGLGAGAAVNTVIALAELYIPAARSECGCAAGLFLQQDFMGAFCAIALIALVLGIERKRWVAGAMIAAAGLGLCLSHSRGAILSAAGALFLAGAWRLTPRYRNATIAAGILFAAGFVAFDAMVVHSRTQTILTRLVEWDYVINNMHWLGWGFGTLGSVFTFEHAENEFVELAFDLGLLSLIFWAFVAQALTRVKANVSSFVLVGLILDGLTSFPLHNPATAFVAAVALGDLCGARNMLLRRRRARAAFLDEHSGSWLDRRPYPHLS